MQYCGLVSRWPRQQKLSSGESRRPCVAHHQCIGHQTLINILGVRCCSLLPGSCTEHMKCISQMVLVVKSFCAHGTLVMQEMLGAISGPKLGSLSTNKALQGGSLHPNKHHCVNARLPVDASQVIPLCQSAGMHGSVRCNSRRAIEEFGFLG